MCECLTWHHPAWRAAARLARTSPDTVFAIFCALDDDGAAASRLTPAVLAAGLGRRVAVVERVLASFALLGLSRRRRNEPLVEPDGDLNPVGDKLLVEPDDKLARRRFLGRERNRRWRARRRAAARTIELTEAAALERAIWRERAARSRRRRHGQALGDLFSRQSSSHGNDQDAATME